jgi:enterochelin esterase family protein
VLCSGIVSPQSPRITALETAIRTDQAGALEAFWHEIDAHGTPLVEPVPGLPKSVLVTLLWREREPVDHVAVGGGPTGEPPGSWTLMRRLSGTDVWFETWWVRSDARFCYRLAPGRSAEPSESAFVIDPLNPLGFPRHSPCFSVAQLSDAVPDEWDDPKPTVRQGSVTQRRVRSAILGNERTVWTYLPPADPPEGGYRCLILTDGGKHFRGLDVPAILDHLIAEGRIRPLAAILIDNIDPLTRQTELSCHRPFVDFVADEIVSPFTEELRLSRAAADLAIGGSSLGGLIALYAALERPDCFGNVLAHSSSFWWFPEWFDHVPAGAEPEPGFLIRLVRDREPVPVRIHLGVGVLEADGMAVLEQRGTLPGILPATRHMRDILSVRGYDVSYSEVNGGHDPLAWRTMLVDGLESIFGAPGRS